MRKLKIYLDTSVVSYLNQEDAPDKMADTLQFWEELKKDIYSICVSETLINEISQCKEPKRSILFQYLSEIDYELITVNFEMEQLAEAIITQGILTKKSYDDCTHIAAAVISNCDIIVSWNFQHMVNVKTINGIRAINILNGYKPIDIYPPNVLRSGGNNNG